MTPQTHAVPPGPVHRAPGQCRWFWHFEDVDLACVERAIPGGQLCPEHEIEKERRRTHGQSR